MKTLEQEFASQIYEQVLEYREKPDHKQYGSMAYKLPILIRTAGLAQALAFVESRGKKSYDQLLDHLAKVVINSDRKMFLEKSREAEMQEYISHPSDYVSTEMV